MSFLTPPAASKRPALSPRLTSPHPNCLVGGAEPAALPFWVSDSGSTNTACICWLAVFERSAYLCLCVCSRICMCVSCSLRAPLWTCFVYLDLSVPTTFLTREHLPCLADMV